MKFEILIKYAMNLGYFDGSLPSSFVLFRFKPKNKILEKYLKGCKQWLYSREKFDALSFLENRRNNEISKHVLLLPNINFALDCYLLLVKANLFTITLIIRLQSWSTDRES